MYSLPDGGIMRKIFIITAAAAFLLAGCKPSLESEQKQLESKKRTIDQYQAKYSGFSEFLVPLEEQISQDVKAIEKLSDDESKAEALDQLNSKIAKHPVYDGLHDYEFNRRELESFIDRYAGRRVKYRYETTFANLNSRINASEMLLNQLQSQMNRLNPADEASAINQLEQINDQLGRADRLNDRVKRKLSEEQRELRELEKKSKQQKI